MDICFKVSRLCKQIRRNFCTAPELLLDLTAQRIAVKKLEKYGSGMPIVLVSVDHTDYLNFAHSRCLSFLKES